MIVTNGKAAQFLGPAKTADYRPSLVSPLPLWSGHDVGWYSWHDVEWMRRDPQCQFGLRILRGPLATVTWEIPASSPEVAAWVDRTLRKVWTHYLNKVTAHLEYGSCGGETTWRYDRTSDLIELDELLDIHILDMKPLQQSRKQVGVRVKGSAGGVGPTDLYQPRYWWIANEPEFGAYHGRARLSGAWIPWQEKTARHGARDVRRLWYVKNVMDGGTMYHPPGETLGPDGRLMANVDYAREMMEKGLAGGVRVFPNVTDEKGKRLWEYEPPRVNGELTGVHEHMHDLDQEILIGMNIPPEVVQAADTGSGWSGRSVPFLVFLTSEDQLADTTIQAIDRCVLRPGVGVNFGEDARYEIKLKSLVKQAEEEEAKKKGMVPGAKPGETAAQGQEQKPGPPQGQGQQPMSPAAPVRMSVQHAPPGGVTIGGQDFKGGEFIPADVLKKATKEEKTALKQAGKQEETRRKRRELHAEENRIHGRQEVVEERPHPQSGGHGWDHPFRLEVESLAKDVLSRGGKKDIGIAFRPRLGWTQLEDENGRILGIVETHPEDDRVIVSATPGSGRKRFIDPEWSDRKIAQTVHEALRLRLPEQLTRTPEEEEEHRAETEKRQERHKQRQRRIEEEDEKE